MTMFLIIGGGIGGMTTALALAQAGFDVHVAEQAPRFGEIGAGIQLAPNAMRILERLGLRPTLDEVSVQPRNLVFMHADTGKRLGVVDLGPAFRRHFGQAYTVLHRGDLLEVLLAACRANPRITLETGREMVAVSADGEVRFADGTLYRCDGVVGADGLWSRTRKLICDDEPICAQYVAYRGTLPTTSAVEQDDEVIWIGPDKHLVQYPIRRGELYNQVAVFRSRRFRPGTDDWGTPEELTEAFAASCEEVRSSVALMPTDRRWPMYDRLPIATWTKGRVTLLGDAAHPMLQYLAQGACQAIEDAACLARHLAKHGGDVAEAFAGYQAERGPRTGQVQTVARAWGEIWHAGDLVIPALRDRVFARRAADDYTDLDWLYQEAL
ncbi:FAD-dependent monooxygenase [Nonomuraea guangzhouensis]|uniref:FAD-dependent monooxygenase n=1 Tax=Nonomuraea guangzhouensis TaxID=1291555 RepID=A0ABW4G8Q6_9ACTN|nr:FAD-dependent monooxygenase [Nonomuraea guangzhouensis]